MSNNWKFAIAVLIAAIIYPPILGLFLGLAIFMCFALVCGKIVNDFSK